MTGRSADIVQLLDAAGKRVEHDRFQHSADPDQLRRYLREMTLGRRLDEEATALQRHGELALWPPSLGQEAAQVGLAAAVGPNDVVFPSYREHVAALSLGVDFRQLLALYRGSDNGDWPDGDRFRNYCFVVGAQTLHAVGYAMGMVLDAERDGGPAGAVLCCHGDGASAQGDVNEAYVFAATERASVVFFVQNNQWAISEPTSRQSRIPLFERARGFGFPGVQVDGNDVLAVRAVSDWAMAHARSGQGPVLIEAFTYRLGAHTTSDDPTKYRSNEEEQRWRAQDPIVRLTNYLEAEELIDDDYLAELRQAADQFAAEVRTAISGLADRGMLQQFEDTFVEQTAELLRQRRDYAEFVQEAVS